MTDIGNWQMVGGALINLGPPPRGNQICSNCSEDSYILYGSAWICSCGTTNKIEEDKCQN